MFNRLPLPLLAWMAVLGLGVLSTIGCDPSPKGIQSGSPVSDAGPPGDFGQLMLVDSTGATKTVTELSNGKHLVIVVSRGYFGEVCTHCSAQAHDLAMGYDEIQALGANLVLIFPVANSADSAKWKELEINIPGGTQGERKGFPFPVLFDTGLKLVDRLGIRGQLAKPSTYIIDSKGLLKFSYVGRDPADRPRFGTILEQLKLLN